MKKNGKVLHVADLIEQLQELPAGAVIERYSITIHDGSPLVYKDGIKKKDAPPEIHLTIVSELSEK
jgi:hypothetical protein